MAVTQFPQETISWPPFFSASWVGRTPADRYPRLVNCFGPSEPDDFAAVQAAVLGLESLLYTREPPRLSRVWVEVEDQSLVVIVRGYDGHDHGVMRTGPLSESLVNVLRWRPEVLLVWVDVPLREPTVELASVGLKHIWTGVAPVRELQAEARPDGTR